MQKNPASASEVDSRLKLGVRTVQPVHAAEISPANFQAVLFDMDGVVTKTATIHEVAWKEVFDKLLEAKFGQQFEPFSEEDYLKYVDGKVREDGIRSFLNSRQIALPEGSKDDPSGFKSVHAIGQMKDDRFLDLLHSRGVELYESTIMLIRTLKAAGIKTALLTSSRNGTEILKTAKIGHLFDYKIDGVDAERLGLNGKPHPDVYLHTAQELGVSPKHTVVIEDAAAGVESGQRGGFGLVIGVARTNNIELLKKHGADVVVSDLAEVKVAGDKTSQTPAMVLAELKVSEEDWVITYNEFSPVLEEQRESLCALGNGYFCTRGAAAESHDDGVHYPGTYLAGGYNRVQFNDGDRKLEQEQLVNLPNWLSVIFKLNGGKWFDLRDVEILSYQQRLDLRQGVLLRTFKFRDEEGQETSVSHRSFVHMRYPHLAALEITWTAHNWSGEITICSALDGRVTNNSTQMDQPDDQKHFEYLQGNIKEDVSFLEVMTKQSHFVVAEAARNTLSTRRRVLECERVNTIESGYVSQAVKVCLTENTPVTLEKIVALYTSRDRGISEPGESARNAVADAPDFDRLLADHVERWLQLWRQFDLFVDTNEAHSKTAPSLLLHLCAFHTLQTASPNTIDLDVGLPARGWTGEGYQGHVFWDALFVFPFLNLHMPAITASLLKYRYRRLDAAREMAKKSGASGARFPWQSASDGKEVTPTFDWNSSKRTWIPDNSAMQIHVNASIAYDIWQYYQVTADLDFMSAYGAEMLFEIARFFATTARYDSGSRRYGIVGVVGPDEFHTAYPGSKILGIDNNAYTNVMAVWTLTAALELLQILPTDHKAQILQRLKISDDEIKQWDLVSRNMFIPFVDKNIISQFEGFESLLDFPSLEDGTLDPTALESILDREHGTPNEYKVCKQADVLLLFYVFSADELKELFGRLGYTFESADIRKNIEYYLPKTTNGSTLSRLAHVWVLSRLDRLSSWNLLAATSTDKTLVLKERTNQPPHSWPILLEALNSDYGEIHHDSTREGIHIGAMGGTLDIVQRCYTGIVVRKDVLWLNPQLPRALNRLSFTLHYRGQALAFDITRELLKVTAMHSSALPIKIGFDEVTYQLKAGDNRVFTLKS